MADITFAMLLGMGRFIKRVFPEWSRDARRNFLRRWRLINEGRGEEVIAEIELFLKATEKE